MSRLDELVQSAADVELPEAEPLSICGIDLNAVESGRFLQAQRIGVLEITPDLPVSSPLPEAWKRWNEERGMPVCVVEVPLRWGQNTNSEGTQ
jgi:hypothetical protein